METMNGKKISAYLEQNLLINEVPIYAAKLHGKVYFKPALISVCLFVLGIMFISVGSYLFFSISIFIFIIFGLIPILNKKEAELVLTNQRVISKIGFFTREISDIKLSKIEGISIHQTIGDRIWGCASVWVKGRNGTGCDGQVAMPYISDYVEFKSAIQNQINQD